MVFSAQSPGEAALMKQVVTILVDYSPSEAAPMVSIIGKPSASLSLCVLIRKIRTLGLMISEFFPSPESLWQRDTKTPGG